MVFLWTKSNVHVHLIYVQLASYTQKRKMYQSKAEY